MWTRVKWPKAKKTLVVLKDRKDCQKRWQGTFIHSDMWKNETIALIWCTNLHLSSCILLLSEKVKSWCTSDVSWSTKDIAGQSATLMLTSRTSLSVRLTIKRDWDWSCHRSSHVLSQFCNFDSGRLERFHSKDMKPRQKEYYFKYKLGYRSPLRFALGYIGTTLRLSPQYLIGCNTTWK